LQNIKERHLADEHLCRPTARRISRQPETRAAGRRLDGFIRWLCGAASALATKLTCRNEAFMLNSVEVQRNSGQVERFVR